MQIRERSSIVLSPRELKRARNISDFAQLEVYFAKVTLHETRERARVARDLLNHERNYGEVRRFRGSFSRKRRP